MIKREFPSFIDFSLKFVRDRNIGFFVCDPNASSFDLQMCIVQAARFLDTAYKIHVVIRSNNEFTDPKYYYEKIYDFLDTLDNYNMNSSIIIHLRKYYDIIPDYIIKRFENRRFKFIDDNCVITKKYKVTADYVKIYL